MIRNQYILVFHSLQSRAMNCIIPIYHGLFFFLLQLASNIDEKNTQFIYMLCVRERIGTLAQNIHLT